jgi:hypothetical protein
MLLKDSKKHCNSKSVKEVGWNYNSYDLNIDHTRQWQCFQVIEEQQN